MVDFKHKGEFEILADKRLEKGKIQYDDAWKKKSPVDIVSEAKQECLDLRNYALMAYEKLCKIGKILKGLEK